MEKFTSREEFISEMKQCSNESQHQAIESTKVFWAVSMPTLTQRVLIGTTGKGKSIPDLFLTKSEATQEASDLEADLKEVARESMDEDDVWDEDDVEIDDIDIVRVEWSGDPSENARVFHEDSTFELVNASIYEITSL